MAEEIKMAETSDLIEGFKDAPRIGEPVLRIDNVVKRFGDNTVLDHISFDVCKHETVALLGPSGSGKSTLMKCVNLLEQVNDGQIWLGDTDITDPRIDEDKTRARIGVVFQQFNLFPHMTVLNNVTLAAGTATRPRTKRGSCSSASVWTRRLRNTPIACPVASNSAWPSRAP